jgi:hypothetical protein
VGYYTLAATSVALNGLPAKTSKRLPRYQARGRPRAARGQGAQAEIDRRRNQARHDAVLVLPAAAGAGPLQARRPGAARGRFGVVELVHGCHAFPDADTVVFDGRELWGADADPTVKVSIDAFEPYLDPA